ncbi:MAG: PQQ-binding-like beta-propeller repeat protein [Pseudomonadota bacterium]
MTLALRPSSRRSRSALCLSAALVMVLTGCGSYFGEEEVPLEGTRIPVRRADPGAQQEFKGTARIPAARRVADWAQAGGASVRTSRNIEGDLALDELWSSSIGAGSDDEARIVATPVIAGETLVALDAAATLTALDRTSGDERWELDLTPEDEDGRDGFGGGLAISKGLVIAASGFGRIHGVDLASGEEKWVYQAPAPIRAAPALSEGVAVAVTRNGIVIGLDAATGEQRWRFSGMDGGAGMLSGAAPAIAGEVVAIPFSTGDIMVARLRDGRRGWNESLGARKGGSAMSLISDVSSSPVIEQGRIYAGTISGRVAAFEVQSGRRLWARDLGLYNPIWAAGETLFMVTDTGALVALRSDSGRTIWQTQLPQYDDPEERRGAFAYGGPIMVGGKLYLTSSDGVLFEVDAATGEKLRELDIPSSTVPPISAGGVLYVLDENGTVHAFR